MNKQKIVEQYEAAVAFRMLQDAIDKGYTKLGEFIRENGE